MARSPELQVHVQYALSQNYAFAQNLALKTQCPVTHTNHKTPHFQTGNHSPDEWLQHLLLSRPVKFFQYLNNFDWLDYHQ